MLLVSEADYQDNT